MRLKTNPPLPSGGTIPLFYSFSLFFRQCRNAFSPPPKHLSLMSDQMIAASYERRCEGSNMLTTVFPSSYQPKRDTKNHARTAQPRAQFRSFERGIARFARVGRLAIQAFTHIAIP